MISPHWRKCSAEFAPLWAGSLVPFQLLLGILRLAQESFLCLLVTNRKSSELLPGQQPTSTLLYYSHLRQAILELWILVNYSVS